MKLAAARPGQDHIDMVALWPHCSFDSAAAAVAAFHLAYPMEADDPYLVASVAEIALASGRR
jgi:hypothetical protein